MIKTVCRNTLLILSVLSFAACVEKPILGQSAVTKIVKAMSVSEKASLLTLDWNDGDSALHTFAIERLGIPSVRLAGCGRFSDARMSAVRRSWNPGLVSSLGMDIADQMAATTDGSPYSLLLDFDRIAGSNDEYDREGILLERYAWNLAKGINRNGTVVTIASRNWSRMLKNNVVPNAAVVAIADSSNVFDALSAGCVMAAGNAEELGQAIVNAVDSERISYTQLNSWTVQILEYLLKVCFGEIPLTQSYSDSLRTELFDQFARQSTVLLKNDRTLPLGTGKTRLSVYGAKAYDQHLDLIASLEKTGYQIEPSVLGMYTRMKQTSPDTDSIGALQLERKPYQYRADAISSQAALIVVGCDKALDEKLIADVCNAFHFKNRKVIMVLTETGSITSAMTQSAPDAILLATDMGKVTGQSLAGILCGRENPSGHLARPIWGYDFGFGLGYTEFSLDRPKVQNRGKLIHASVSVTNTGVQSGNGVVMACLKWDNGSHAPQLAAVAKTDVLEPGESETLEFVVSRPDAGADSRIEFSDVLGRNAVNTFIPVIE